MLRIAQQRHHRVEGPGELRAVCARVALRGVELVGTGRKVGAVHREQRQEFGDGISATASPSSSRSRCSRSTSDRRMLSAIIRFVEAISSCQGIAGATPSRRERRVEGVERPLAGGIRQHPVELGQRVVSRRAVGRPERRQLLARLEDLLDQREGAAGETRKPIQVIAGTLQAVGVVDAQSVDEPLIEPAPTSAWASSNTCGSSTRIAARLDTAKNRR